MFDLKNKVVIVVGGRGYLGRDFCQKLSSQNAIVISADLTQASKAALSSSFAEEFKNIEQYDVDVTNKNSVAQLVSEIISKYGKIDTLVYSVTAKPHDF